MPVTLSFGFVRPETGDRGSVFFPDLEDNITQLNAHDHDGVDSAKLTAASSDAVAATITSVGWASSGSGYRQLVTVPSGFDVDLMVVIFRDSTSGEQLFLDTTKVSDTTYYVYCNDNTVALKAIYST
jgi:hypothetical protein